ncbi:DUF503 domain-containing protein [Desulfitibacter alkalitolerans]|uniref:DUF503 domain-containing protein n=1 Tax=Desulfitibacter alkalitolerans TaxID=264641 RepID=UPI00048858D5|nr:DUF503 domain-containing protein [Desulfitibacter alkalitolerans]
MKVGVCTLELRIPYAHSLKEKRSIVKRISNKIKQKFNVSISEIDTQDLWQTATLGIAVVGSHGPLLEGFLETLIDYVESTFDGEIRVLHTEVIAV